MLPLFFFFPFLKVFSQWYSSLKHLLSFETQIPAPSHHSRSVTSLQSESRFPQSSCSYVGRTSEARHVQSPSMNDFLRPSSLPVRSVESPNVLPKDVKLVQLPVANSMPPSGARSCARGLATLPALPLMAKGGQGPSLVYRSPWNIQFKRPSEEIIIISDDEEDQIDLTLRL
ncbi:hypothetical protein ACJIZ3_017062 [Penstemon smallii]|uniref:Uncharacterized protein n=1 Tax=Penstemon smallii TaxID=265156 RepID=A0ABD3SUH3_9LAMI